MVLTFHSFLSASAFGYQHPYLPFRLSPRSLRCDLLAARSKQRYPLAVERRALPRSPSPALRERRPGVRADNADRMSICG